MRAADGRAARRGVLVLPRAARSSCATAREPWTELDGEAAAQVAEPLLLDDARSRRSTTRRTSSTSRTRAAPTRSSTRATSPPASASTGSSPSCPTFRSATTCGPSSCARTRPGLQAASDRLAHDRNAAFEAALAAGGAIDTSVGVPEVAARTCSSSTASSATRPTTPSRRRARAGSRCPRATCSRSRPSWDADELGDPVELLMAEHDRHDIRRAIVSRRGRARRTRASASTPTASSRSIGVDPNQGMEAVRKIERYAEEFDLKCVGAFPAGLNPQVAVDDKKWYPDLHEVRRARHPVRVDDGRARAAHPVRTAGRRPARRDLLVLPRAEVRHPPRLRAVDRRSR